MSSFFDRLKSKRGTRTNFSGKPDRSQVSRPLPEPKPVPKPAAETAEPTTAEEGERAEVDTNVERAAGRASAADNQVKPPAQDNKGKAKGSEIPSGTYTVTDLSGKDAYQHFWESEIPYDLIPVQHPRVNYYTPNCTSLFKTIDVTHSLVNNTKFISQQAPDYIPYAVDCYYTALVYRQILRAKRASQTLEGTEKTLLTRWEKSYADEKLVVAKPCFPFMSTIIACELEDRKYDWNVPHVPAAMFKTDTDATHLGSTLFDSSSGASYMLPQFPYMMGVLNQYVQETTAAAQLKIGPDDIYRPTDINHATQPVTIFGVQISNADATGESMKRLFASSGISQPFLIANENIGTSIKQAKRTDFYHDIKVTAVPIAANPQNQNTLVQQFKMSNLEEFLFMTKTNNLRWFDLLLSNAITHARHFPGAENMSTVPTVGGLETCVVGRYKRDNRVLGDMYFSTLNLNHGATQHRREWYEQTLKNVTCGFATNRAGTSRKESLQAMSFATNASPPVKLTGQNDPISHRTGKLYDNKEWTEEYGNEDDEFGKPMFVSWPSVIRKMFSEKPAPPFNN